ncbi:MAG: OsmC family peroxiredoxin [Dehalococcoidia bacterium]|nr:OsmC family peroxiredoxin [Dehalococcoidia bacterium]
MATVHADYQDRKRIVFTTRGGRSIINVRETLADGMVGYTSTELLLVALGNCTLGALLNQPLLLDVPVTRAEATLEATMAQNPTRVVKIDVVLDLEVEDHSVLANRDELEALACTCPICNTLSGVEITSHLNLSVREPVAI